MLEIGRTVLARRGADGDEDNLGLTNATGERGGEGQPLLALVPADQFLEPGLVDRDLAALQQAHLDRVLVDADDVVAVLGQAGPGHQSDIPAANHRYLHSPPNPKP